MCGFYSFDEKGEKAREGEEGDSGHQESIRNVHTSNIFIHTD